MVPWGIFQNMRGRGAKRIFAFVNLLRRCASWPTMHERHSRAGRALDLRAGRGKKWQLVMGQQAWSPSKHRLFCPSQKPWGNGAKGRAELAPLPLQTCPGQESPREPGHERCLGGARAAGRELGERAQRSPARGLCSLLQRTRSNPREHHLEPGLGVRKVPPPRCGARGPPSWSTSSGHLATMAPRSPCEGPCSVLQRKAKNPRGHLLAHRGG